MYFDVPRCSLSLIATLLFIAASAQNITFRDSAFKQALLKRHNIDGNKDKEIDIKEASKVTTLNVSHSQITSLDGVEHFRNLKILHASSNQVSELVLDGFMKLERLVISGNRLTKLEIRNCPELLSVMCQANELTALDLSGLSKLEILFCSNNQLEQLQLAGCNALQMVATTNNRLTAIDLSGKEKMRDLRCDHNMIREIDIRDCTNISFMYCNGNETLQSLWLGSRKKRVNSLFSLQFDHCPSLKNIYIDKDKEKLADVQQKLKLYGREDVVVTIE
ncbi:MAG: hypothetical protein K0Q66_1466 [Chitinophagaceae bacterium]|nr:hypothetical protein [Chitinophagaceae bacterium]